MPCELCLWTGGHRSGCPMADEPDDLDEAKELDATPTFGWELDVHETLGRLRALAGWCPCGTPSCRHTDAARAALAALAPITVLFDARPRVEVPANDIPF